jgi:hypothetical protein
VTADLVVPTFTENVKVGQPRLLAVWLDAISASLSEEETMHGSNAPSALQQAAFVVIVPPIITALWWLGSRGWANVVQAGNVSERTKRRQKWEFWAVLTIIYIIVVGFAGYAHFSHR